MADKNNIYDKVIDNLLLFLNDIGESLIECTKWRCLTDEASYEIDENDGNYLISRKPKNDEIFPLIYLEKKDSGWNIFSWKEDGWTKNFYEEILELNKNLAFSYQEYLNNKEKKLILKTKVKFSLIGKNFKKTHFEIADNLNKEIKGLLDEELIPVLDTKELEHINNVSNEYLYVEKYEEWKDKEIYAFNAKWEKVYEGLQTQIYYRPKDAIESMITRQRNLFKSNYIIVTKLPFAIDSEKQDNYITDFCQEKELKEKTGPNFNLEECKKHTKVGGHYICDSRFNEYYYRLSYGMVFYCTSIRKKDWKYAGILNPGQEELFKVI